MSIHADRYYTGPMGPSVNPSPMAVTLTKEQFSAYAHHNDEGEVVMINLLHFSEQEEGRITSAEDARRECGDAAMWMVEGRGGRVLWMGEPEHVDTGDPDADGWDMAVLVSYPRRGAFISAVSAPDRAISRSSRRRGLVRTFLADCRPHWHPIDDVPGMGGAHGGDPLGGD
jgi:hypothetical protein